VTYKALVWKTYSSAFSMPHNLWQSQCLSNCDGILRDFFRRNQPITDSETNTRL